MFQLRKKTIAVTTAAFVIAGGGAAFAYWTTTGAGEGSAANADNAAKGIVLSASWDPASLAPGAELPVTITAENEDTTTDQYVGTVSKSTITVDSLHSTCAVADFSFAPVVANEVVKAGQTVTLTKTGTLVFANTSADQGGCKGATITLKLTSN